MLFWTRFKSSIFFTINWHSQIINFTWWKWQKICKFFDSMNVCLMNSLCKLISFESLKGFFLFFRETFFCTIWLTNIFFCFYFLKPRTTPVFGSDCECAACSSKPKWCIVVRCIYGQAFKHFFKDFKVTVDW